MPKTFTKKCHACGKLLKFSKVKWKMHKADMRAILGTPKRNWKVGCKTCPRPGAWLDKNEEAKASVDRGLKQASEGKFVEP